MYLFNTFLVSISYLLLFFCFFFLKQKTAYEMRISDWSSDVCSSDLGYTTYVEPIDDVYRTYYYQPGAAEPYFIRDPYYGYGYSGGTIAVIYGPDGRALDRARWAQQRRAASRYYARARHLRGAARHRHHYGVAARQWAVRRDAIDHARHREIGRAHV